MPRWRSLLPGVAAAVGAVLVVMALAAWHVVAARDGSPAAVPWLVACISFCANIALADALVRCLRDRRVERRRFESAARHDRDLLAGRDRIIAARDAEIDRLNAEVMAQAAEIEALAGGHKPRRPIVSQYQPKDAAEAAMWRAFEADIVHPAPPGIPDREWLDGTP